MTADDDPETRLIYEDFEEHFTFGDWVDLRVEMGWGLGRSEAATLSGWFVYLIWAIEALIVIFLSVTRTVGAAANPFCERCDAWTEATGVGQTSKADAGAVHKATREGALQAFLDVERVEDGPTLVWTVDRCPACKDTTLVSIAMRWLQQQSAKEVKEKTETVLEHAIPTAEEKAAILDRFSRKLGGGPA